MKGKIMCWVRINLTSIFLKSSLFFNSCLDSATLVYSNVKDNQNIFMAASQMQLRFCIQWSGARIPGLCWTTSLVLHKLYDYFGVFPKLWRSKYPLWLHIYFRNLNWTICSGFARVSSDKSDEVTCFAMYLITLLVLVQKHSLSSKTLTYFLDMTSSRQLYPSNLKSRGLFVG